MAGLERKAYRDALWLDPLWPGCLWPKSYGGAAAQARHGCIWGLPGPAPGRSCRGLKFPFLVKQLFQLKGIFH